MSANDEQLDSRAKQLILDYKTAFMSDAGVRVLEDLIKKSTINRTVVSGDPSVPIDTNRLIYSEGQRSVLLYIQSKINHEPTKE